MELLTVDDLVSSLRITRQTLAAWVGHGTFPAPLRIGPRSVRWRRDAIERWLRAVEASGFAGPGFRATDWRPPAGEPSAFERLAAATDDELAASLVAADDDTA